MATVEEDSWHGKVSSREAERRLVAGGCDIKRNKFILSYISDKTRGLIKHLIVPVPSKKGFSSVCDAFSVMDRMVVSSDHCSNPVPPLIVNRDNGDMSEDDEEILCDLACYVCVCDTVCESKVKLKSHIQLHTVVECEDCHKFIGKGTITAHIRKCKDLPRKVHACDQCDYKTKLTECQIWIIWKR